MYSEFDNVYDMIEHAIDYAFQGKMQLKFYEFLKASKRALSPLKCAMTRNSTCE